MTENRPATLKAATNHSDQPDKAPYLHRELDSETSPCYASSRLKFEPAMSDRWCVMLRP